MGDDAGTSNVDETIRLMRVVVQSFQSYGSRPQEFCLDPHLNMLIGKNDVGKSALFRALQAVCLGGLATGADFALCLTYIVPKGELRHVISAMVQSMSDRLGSLPDAVPIELQYSGANIWNPGPVPARMLQSAKIGDGSATLTRAVNGQGFAWAGSGNAGAREMLELLSAIAARHVFVAAKRSSNQYQTYKVPLQATVDLASDGSNIASVLHNIKSDDDAAYSRIKALLQRAFPRVREVGTPIDRSSSGASNLQVEPEVWYVDGSKLPLQDCGTGIEELAILLTAIFAAESGRIVAVDEPGVHLHPAAQHALLGCLVDNPRHQYVLITHSTYFRTHVPLGQTFRIRLDERRESVVDHAPTSQELASELGITSAMLFQPEAILWVEGPTEEAVIPLVAPDAIKLGIAVRAVPSVSEFTKNPASTRSMNEIVTAVTGVLSATNVPSRFLFDRDEKDERRQDAITSAGSGQVDFLSCREIENLFLVADWIAEAIRERAAWAEVVVDMDAQRVATALETELGKHEDRELYPGGTPANPREDVRGSSLLARLYWKFGMLNYDKPVEGARLARIAMRDMPETFGEIQSSVAKLQQSAKLDRALVGDG